MSGRIIFLRRVQLAGGVPHTTFLGLRSAMKLKKALQNQNNQENPGNNCHDDIPITVSNRNGVEQCVDG